jgi:hypothetical protein
LTGASAGLTDKLVKQAGAIQNLTRFGDEQVLVVQRNLILLGAEEKQLDALTQLTLDFAEAKGRSAVEVSMLVGRALQGEMTMFKRQGLVIDETLTKTEQLQSIFKQMRDQSRAGGQGAAMALGATDIGAVAQAGNAWGDLKKHAGEFMLIIGSDTMRTLTQVISDITEGVKMLSGAISSIKADSPFMKMLLTSPLTNLANLSKAAGVFSSGGSLQAIADAAMGKTKTGTTPSPLGGTDAINDMINKVKVPKSAGELEKLTMELDAFRGSLMQLGSTRIQRQQRCSAWYARTL